MEKIPEQNFGKEYSAPFERQEEKMIRHVDAIKSLGEIIKISDDTKEKNPYDIVEAAKDYLGHLGGVDQEAAKRLSDLIVRAEEELSKRRIESAKNTLRGLKSLGKVHDPRKLGR